MTSDKTESTDLNAVEDDVPTAELEVLTEADIAAMDVLGDDFDGSWPTSRAELHVRAQIGELQSEIEQLRSDSVELSKETRTFKELRDKTADELREATRKNAELTALLAQRDEELAALKSPPEAKSPTAEKLNGDAELAAEEVEPRVLPQHEFAADETRKLVGRSQYASHEFAIRPGEMSLGSAVDNDIRIENAFISRHHAQIHSTSRETVLKDMNSTNGTYVNSRRINKCALHDGDSVTIGKLSFTFVRQGKSAQTMRPVTQMTAPEYNARPGRGTWR